MQKNRRNFLKTVAASVGVIGALPPSIAKALSIDANNKKGTIEDVEHIVILTQENRSFDHYFGTMAGVRGFGDRHIVPKADEKSLKNKNIFLQLSKEETLIAPFHLNTTQSFQYMRVRGTPHTWSDAQAAWNDGRMNKWPKHKENHSMGYYNQEDIPFQFALANAFTICDAYHCSFQGGTNPNRLFLWTGTNDPDGKGNGPATYNDYDWFDTNPGQDGGYSWTTYPERLEEAGVSWQVYQNMKDNYTDNALAGFQSFRDAWYERENYSESLKKRGVTTRDLDKLKEDVVQNKLPQVSWIVATAQGSEHPNASSPAQGAEYTQKVLDALTSNPDVWSKTVFIVNFDENDGFFDHVPPPAVPSYQNGKYFGLSTVSTDGEYHKIIKPYHTQKSEKKLMHKPYGLGPRVPAYIISPWSKGGWVNSEVFDHTSIIKFIEKRFGVFEPNISSWRRTVCGDLTSTLNFKSPNNQEFLKQLPSTEKRAAMARELGKETYAPQVPMQISMPYQHSGIKLSRAIGYELESKITNLQENKLSMTFSNSGSLGAVFHVYDKKNLEKIPHRYTVEAKKTVTDVFELIDTTYDFWILGPNGYHRHFIGDTQIGEKVTISLEYASTKDTINISMQNETQNDITLTLSQSTYTPHSEQKYVVKANAVTTAAISVKSSFGWYDFMVSSNNKKSFTYRYAGHLENGKPSISDPAFCTEALS